MMNSRMRFRQTMRYGAPDRVPYLEEAVREEVFETWRAQGMPLDRDLSQLFLLDRHEIIEPELAPRPKMGTWPGSMAELQLFRRRLDAADLARFPEGWPESVRLWGSRDHLLMLRVHQGFFLSMGVDGWRRFTEAACLLVQDPDFVREMMMIQGEFAAALADKVLRETEVDAALFVEPICGMHGPLISPQAYETLVLRSYEPLLALLASRKVETIIWKSFSNARLLLPSILAWGFNCLWAGEADAEAMDYRDIRRNLGRDLRLIGGIDLDALRLGKEAIRREIEEKVTPLLREGGYVPLADGRMREDVPYENYVYYRRLLEEVTGR
jgi:hypothetical protein